MPSIQPSTIGPSFEFQRGLATVQIEQVESPAPLPTLDALDAEFGCEDEQCAPVRRKQGGASMDSAFRPIQSEFPTHPRAARPTVGAIKPSSLDGAIMRPSLARRVLRRLARQGIGNDIAKLQADEQAILSKLSAGPPRPSVAPARKPAAVTPPPSPSAQARTGNDR
jgi:hypothetical protein